MIIISPVLFSWNFYVSQFQTQHTAMLQDKFNDLSVFDDLELTHKLKIPRSKVQLTFHVLVLSLGAK